LEVTNWYPEREATGSAYQAGGLVVGALVAVEGMFAGLGESVQHGKVAG